MKPKNSALQRSRASIAGKCPEPSNISISTRPPKAPEPRAPRRFRVVEITTHRVLADDTDARATLAALRDVHSVVDVAISVWDPEHDRWRLLTHGEQKALWDMRGAERRQAAGAQP